MGVKAFLDFENSWLFLGFNYFVNDNDVFFHLFEGAMPTGVYCLASISSLRLNQRTIQTEKTSQNDARVAVVGSSS